MIKDKEIIRELAKQYMEIAFLDCQKETAKRYKDLNSLRPTIPVVLIDELPWNELNINEELSLCCQDIFARNLETDLRRKLFQWKYFRGDMYISPYIGIDRAISVESIGISVDETVLETDSLNSIVAHEYHDQLPDYKSLDKLRIPKVTVDLAEENRRLEKANELLGGIIPAKLIGITNNSFQPWDDIAIYRGVTNLLIDLVDRPDFCHSIMVRLTEIKLALLAQFEELNLLQANEPLIHCTPAFADELDYEGDHPTSANIWGRGAAQIFGDVSRSMHEEFDLNYQKKVFEGSGLVYYGCCEPLHTKIDLVEKIPNLRKISITPWADVRISAECIGDKYVLARKPNPAHLIGNFNKEVVRSETLETLKACRDNNTPCEFVLKDISTVNYKLQNLIDWEQTVTETIRNF